MRPQDTIHTWCYPEKKVRVYILSDIRRKWERAMSTKEAAQILNRGFWHVHHALEEGKFPMPQYCGYGYSYINSRRVYKWSPKDVLAAHEYFSTIHQGRPRKDGKTTPASDLPTRAEIIAMIRQEIVTYIKTSDGEFVPIWKEKDW